MLESKEAERPQPHKIRFSYNFNTVLGAVFVVLSVLIAVAIPSQIEEPLIRMAENESDLKPTLFPGLVAAGFFVLGIWLVWKSFSLEEQNRLKELDRDAVVNVAITLVVMTAYALVMTSLGFVVSSALVIVFLSTFFGNRNFWLAGLVSLAVPVAIFFVFTKLLATYLPPFPVDTLLTRLFLL